MKWKGSCKFFVSLLSIIIVHMHSPKDQLTNKYSMTMLNFYWSADFQGSVLTGYSQRAFENLSNLP